MANAQVEKLKALGIRHGEKAVVALSAALCMVMLVLAVMKKTIEITPDDVDKHAKAAQSSLDTKQEPENILKIIEDAGIKGMGYEALVDAQAKQGLKADDYKVAFAWITPEPGAGLIRDQPALIAPTELVAYPGRGGALIFALDDSGKKILEDPNKKQEEDQATKSRRGRKRNRSMGSGYGGMSMGGMGMPGMMGGGGDPNDPAAKKEYERKLRELKSQLVGKAPVKEKGKEGEAPAEPTGPFKEITRGLRWVSITGVLDHKTMKENWSTALKNPAVQPNYKQLDLQRQVMQADGSWGSWEDVDLEKNRQVLFNLPETEEELASQDAILDNIVDPLPFLKAGLWEKVHIASLVPKEKRTVTKPGGGMMGGEGGYPGMMGGGMAMSGAPGGGYPGMMGRGGGMMMSGGDMGGGMMSGGGMMGGMMGGGSEENLDYQKSEADTVMVRSLDFTVEPDTTYRFRVRVVVFNPNYKREDVTPGVNTKDLELRGPFSEPTEAVTMPADVTTYAMRMTPSGGTSKRNDQVSFQVTRWTSEDGVTVVRNFDAGPGDVIGDPATAAIPTSDGTGAKNKLVDFNSHLLVVDTDGGPRQIAPVGATGAPLDMPALALMLRGDGTVMVRSQVFDVMDTVRKDAADNYAREVKESSKQRESSYGAGMGMMGYPGGGM